MNKESQANVGEPGRIARSKVLFTRSGHGYGELAMGIGVVAASLLLDARSTFTKLAKKAREQGKSEEEIQRLHKEVVKEQNDMDSLPKTSDPPTKKGK